MGCAIEDSSRGRHSPTRIAGLRRLWTDFGESVSDLARAPTPTGWPTARARHIASSALCRRRSASAPCSGQATTPAETAIAQAPGGLELVEHAAAAAPPSAPLRPWPGSAPARRCHPPPAGRPHRRGGCCRAAPRRPPPAPSPARRRRSRCGCRGPRRRRRPGRRGARSGVLRLDQLIEPSPHLPRPVEAGAAGRRSALGATPTGVDRGGRDRAERLGSAGGAGESSSVGLGELLAAAASSVACRARPLARGGCGEPSRTRRCAVTALPRSRPCRKGRTASDPRNRYLRIRPSSRAGMPNRGCGVPPGPCRASPRRRARGRPRPAARWRGG